MNIPKPEISVDILKGFCYSEQDKKISLQCVTGNPGINYPEPHRQVRLIADAFFVLQEVSSAESGEAAYRMENRGILRNM